MKGITNLIYPIFALLSVACFAFLPRAQAVSPAPDGLYPGANVAEGGAGALFSLTYGTNNTALGFQALFRLTQAVENTATGSQALKNNLAHANTADGFQALLKNTQGTQNAAVGWRALFLNTTGNSNTATGYSALQYNITGGTNTANGVAALAGNTAGSANTADGYWALVSSSGNGNIALGALAGSSISTGDSNIDIGSAGANGDSNTIRIGTGGTHRAAFLAGISGTAVVGDPVVVDGNGQLGTVASASRFKKEIKPMDKTSEAILALKPVRFQYKSDSKGTPQFGLIAEEVSKVNPDLVVRDRNGEIYSVRYEAVNAMLLNEFLKEHKTVQEQGAIISLQQKQIAALTAGLQKVNAQLEATKLPPQVVANYQ